MNPTNLPQEISRNQIPVSVFLLCLWVTTMSLNCLSCQLLQRTDSERHRDQQIQTYYCSDGFNSSERSWSGNLSFRPHDRQNRGGLRGLAENKVAPIGHRRAVSYGGKEPRLVRSSGMRRDWSFEDLRTIQEEREPSANS